MLRLALVVSAAIMSFSASAAVSAVKYYITYNSTNCNYEAHMVISSGSNASNWIGGAMQFSIVVPHNSTVSMVSSNEPRTLASSRATASGWTFQTALLAPAAASSVDFYPATVNLSGTPQFPAMATNADVMLFSFTVSTTTCGSGIRMWINNNEDGNPDPIGTPDPFSTASGMNNRDFNNSFQDLSSNELYVGHSTNGTTTLPAPTINGQTGNTITILPSIGTSTFSATANLGSGSCATLSSYVWSGPNGFANSNLALSGTTASAGFSRSIISANIGTYNLTVTNSNGCTSQASLSIVLPVKITAFSGKARGCNAELSWQMPTSEKDYQHFDVQYSADGIRFSTVGQVERNPYNDLYGFSYTQPNGRGFYRLKVTDQGGITTYSETISVTTSCDRSEITISPNPTNAVSVVSGIEAGDQVKVTDMLGNTVANYISGGNKATIDLGIFPTGLYNVIISRDNAVIKTEKLTKQ